MAGLYEYSPFIYSATKPVFVTYVYDILHIAIFSVCMPFFAAVSQVELITCRVSVCMFILEFNADCNST
jgi:hypothetical protein